MNIVLDGMGGDYAPHEMVKGAVQAAELIEDDIYIVGKEDMIQAELNRVSRSISSTRRKSSRWKTAR